MIFPFDLCTAVTQRLHLDASPNLKAVVVRTTARQDAAQFEAQLLLLACDRLCRTLAGTGIGVGALTTNRQATAMAQTAVAAQVHQALDVHRDFAAQIAFDLVVAVDGFTNLQHFGVGQLVDAALGGMLTFSTISWANFGPMP
jgi:hypothetical protein